MTEPDRRTDPTDDQSEEHPDDRPDGQDASPGVADEAGTRADEAGTDADEADTDADEADTDAVDAATSGGTADGEGAGDDRSERVRRALTYGAIGVLSLFALVAAFRFYTQASAAITDWIAPAYRSLFQAVFNLVVLLLAGGGVAYLVRQLGE